MALRWLTRRLPAAQPADLVFLGYVSFSGLVMLAFGLKLSVGVWAGLVLAHVALIVASLWWSRQPLRARSPGGFLRDAYPLFFIAFLYWELRFFAPLFSNGYHDALVLRLEEAVFGAQLALTFSQRFPAVWVSEMFHLFYGLYWLMLPLVLGALYFRRRIEGMRELVFVESVVFFSCYVIYMFFPVAGPFYVFPPIGGQLADGYFYGFVHWVLADGGSKGAAFPSSHVAVAVAVLLVTWRHDRAVWALMLPLVVGLTVGTVYGRFHYAIDASSGVLMALLVVPAARYLRRRWPGPRGVEVGNARNASPV